MNSRCRKILFVPAWAPCSFFDEQQSVYADKYEIYTLTGRCTWLSKKKQLSKFLSSGNIYGIDVSTQNKTCSVDIYCPKYISPNRTENAIRRVSDILGNRIQEFVGKSKLEYVYIQSISDVAIFVADWARRNGIKIILAEHILYIRHSCDYITYKREQLYQTADKIFCVSNYLYRNLLTNGFKMKSVSVVGNLINDEGVPKDWDKIKKNGRIMFVASHLADKDIGILFDAAFLLQKDGYMIDIFGLTGNEEYNVGKTLIEYVTDEGIDSVISFKGKLSHQDMLQVYSNYLILVSTSISETFGLAVAEAIAHGTPVVCTDSGGIREFVDDENGIIVSLKDVTGIYEAIKVISRKKMNYKKISRKILEKYGYESFTKKTII